MGADDDVLGSLHVPSHPCTCRAANCLDTAAMRAAGSEHSRHPQREWIPESACTGHRFCDLRERTRSCRNRDRFSPQLSHLRGRNVRHVHTRGWRNRNSREDGLFSRGADCRPASVLDRARYLRGEGHLQLPNQPAAECHSGGTQLWDCDREQRRYWRGASHHRQRQCRNQPGAPH
jgi:hypothetical protein